MLDSTAGDLILTAAHCMADGIDAYFVPGFADTAAGSDFFHVDAVYLDPRWVSDQDPVADFAIARVSRDGGSVEAQAGGGFRLGTAPKAGTDVTVTGYPVGEGGQPIGCRARHVGHGARVSVVALRGSGRRHQWFAVGGGFGDRRLDRGPGRRRMRGEGVLLAAVRRCRRAAARARRSRGTADDAPTVFDDDC